jgi:hypothetical protein
MWYAATIGKKCIQLTIIQEIRDDHRISLHTIPEVIDFATLAAWLTHCEERHGLNCSLRDISTRYTKPIEIILVDVVQECLILATTSSRYFALSYLWGNAVTATTVTQNLEALLHFGSLRNELVLPKTVSDAMLLTRSMGVRYLWVDCLSIVQNSSKKHQNIADMDIIFSHATLTIVAAASIDADSGLAGVRKGTRSRVSTTRISGPYQLVLELPSDKNDLFFGTTYDSRAWTFQELLLSKRILIVTENQVSLHCNSAHRSESRPEEQPHDHGQFSFGKIDLRPKKTRQVRTILESYASMVRGYSQRRLSYGNDIVNAFSGLASILEEWCDMSPVIFGMLSSHFGYSLLWSFAPGQDYFGAHTEWEIGTRREGFPSWSWTGWVACAKNLSSDSEMCLPLQSLIKRVEIHCYSTRVEAVSSLTVLDCSSLECDRASRAQPILITFAPAVIDSSTTPPSTLAFDAERTTWNGFTVAHISNSCHILAFALPRTSIPCGFLTIVPTEEIATEVLHQSDSSQLNASCQWYLLRLHRLRLQPWQNEDMHDAIQILLDDIEGTNTSSKGYAKTFRRRLQQSDLLSVLLVRRRGQYWERIGSGLMLDEAWPRNNRRSGLRTHYERIVLI